jgi:hypothetical protein
MREDIDACVNTALTVLTLPRMRPARGFSDITTSMKAFRFDEAVRVTSIIFPCSV